jgi:hypothetical protein
MVFSDVESSLDHLCQYVRYTLRPLILTWFWNVDARSWRDMLTEDSLMYCLEQEME